MEIAVSSISSITRSANTELIGEPIAEYIQKLFKSVGVAIIFEVIVVEYEVKHMY